LEQQGVSAPTRTEETVERVERGTAQDSSLNENDGNSQEDQMECRQLTGYAHSSQKVIVRDDGSLVFDLYDFGGETMSEYVTTIYVLGVEAVKARMDMGAWARRPLVSDAEMADALAERFGAVCSARSWLDEKAIAYKEVFDHFATGNVPEY
jgi:hypothetical protein